MKKVELLSPVGNMDMLYQAIHNGCDAVYLSGTKYGARAYARNFNDNELEEALKYSHLYGVKVYITVNTLIYESEVDEFLNYIEFLYKIGVDAVIMQDIGMIYLVRNIFPNLEVHASTQCHNHNEEVIKLFKNLGISRIVFAREVSINDINNINVDIEKEVFVYGALCVSYSGCCLFSSLNGGRSGNRGECVGSCRLPYKLVKNNNVVDINDKYILSTRDLNTLNDIKLLLDSNIDSLKIEGRMKSPYYVGYITKLYRTLIDSYYDGNNKKITDMELNNLKKLFNRKFTRGYLFCGNNIMNMSSPNHLGIPLGKVIKQDKKYTYINLSYDKLSQGDGIRFKNSDNGQIVNKLYNEDFLLTSEVNKNNIAIVDNKFKVKNNELVLKTISKELIDDISNYNEKKILVNFKCNLYIGKKLEISISDVDGNQLSIKGDIIESAKTKEVNNENIVKSLSKLGNTPFKVDNIVINKDDNIFVSLSNLNEVRRNLVEELINVRINKKKNIKIENKDIITKDIVKTENNLNILVRNEEQLKCAIDNKVDNIYVTDVNLYNKYKNKYNVYLRLDRVINKYEDYKNEKLLIGELGSVNKYKNNNTLISDYYLNVTNINSIKFLINNNVKLITLSVELSDYEINNIMNNIDCNVEVIVYGRLELMVMKYCPLKNILNYCDKCNRSSDKFYLEDKSGNRYPIVRNNCITHIMHYKNINKINDVEMYKNMGINNFRIELFDEDYDQADAIIKSIRVKLTK